MRPNRLATVALTLSAVTLTTLIVTARAPQAGAAPAPPQPARSHPDLGAYLVRTMGCNDCHTPLKMGPKGPEPDMSRALTGHPEALKMPPAPKLPPGPWVDGRSPPPTPPGPARGA